MKRFTSLLFACGASVAAVSAEKASFSWDKTRYVYAFGDSYTFVQGSSGHPNFSFIGDAFDFAFSPQELFSDQILPKNTSSDGSNWIEFLTDCFQGPPSACSPRRLFDFAFAGSDISGDLLPLHHNFTVPLIDQVNQWSKYAADLLPHPKDETLVAWWIGINDTGDTLQNATITNFTAFWTQEMQSYFDAVEIVYNKGLRNFLFINVPPEERSPAHVNDTEFGPTLKENIILFNNVLAEFIAQFARTHKDAIAISFDAHSWFNNVLDNPSTFGFKNVTGFCTCPTSEASDFFWFNSGHPTEHVHQLLAAAIQEQLVAESRR
ncbi:carbohydrate esterase family 16 protein [Sphaerobolus stellatus SS14]|nr:carbohydrate esterase family 16 protein [Sphaerobolus stellatus SS14]